MNHKLNILWYDCIRIYVDSYSSERMSMWAYLVRRHFDHLWNRKKTHFWQIKFDLCRTLSQTQIFTQKLSLRIGTTSAEKYFQGWIRGWNLGCSFVFIQQFLKNNIDAGCKLASVIIQEYASYFKRIYICEKMRRRRWMNVNIDLFTEGKEETTSHCSRNTYTLHTPYHRLFFKHK